MHALPRPRPHIPSGLLLALLFVGHSWSAQPDIEGFQTSVRPFLAKSCYGCHSNALQSGGLNLQSFTSAGSVAKDRDEWEKVIEKLRTGQMPPPAVPPPAAADVKLVVGWISSELARLDREVKPDPGRITARRLNRTEYNNSVRDLLGVDFQPAADFPPDDSGYGFDNIGDVLSMSPSLMEKYVSAAEKIARTALYGPPSMKPTMVKHEPWFVDFDTTPGVKTDYDLTGLSLPSALHVMHRFPVEGDYDIAGLLRGARPPGSEPLQVAFWIDGKQVNELPYPIPPTGEVSGQSENSSAPTSPPANIGYRHRSCGSMKACRSPFTGRILRNCRRPAPRGGGRGGRGGTRRTRRRSRRSRTRQARRRSSPARRAVRKPDAVPNNNDELAAANGNGVFGGGATVGFLVSNLEIIGPYNQVTGPSAESRKRIFVCTEETPACAKKIVTTLAGRVYRRPATRQESRSTYRHRRDGPPARRFVPRRALPGDCSACSSPPTFCSASNATRRR